MENKTKSRLCQKPRNEKIGIEDTSQSIYTNKVPISIAGIILFCITLGLVLISVIPQALAISDSQFSNSDARVENQTSKSQEIIPDDCSFILKAYGKLNEKEVNDWLDAYKTCESNKIQIQNLVSSEIFDRAVALVGIAIAAIGLFIAYWYGRKHSRTLETILDYKKFRIFWN